ncbi:MAG: thioredoxin domain-containing protein [Bacteroidales bacterium]
MLHWQPWDRQSLDQASAENKLIIVSIGYAACHWCHVMEHESFSDPEVAALMNRYFVCIKVDREERPDLDQQYMAAVQLINGQGGWPLNCITLPDGKPVFGGTYFRRNDWMVLLDRLATLWKATPGEIQKHADDLTSSVRGYEQISGAGMPPDNSIDLPGIAEQLIRQIDPRQGSTYGAPKFPMPPLQECLLNLTEAGVSTESGNLAVNALRKMAQGGIHDHLGGGFARYTVDGAWRIPHFEKMLYDNAQLAGLFARAFTVSGEALFRDTAYRILYFLNSNLRNSEGFYLGSIDADSEGEEGKFYTWTASEINEILGTDAPLFMARYNCKLDGNFEHGRNILYTLQSENEFIENYSSKEPDIVQRLQVSEKRMLEARAQRIPPQTDTKCVTAWNAMLVSSMVSMSDAFGDPDALDMACDLMAGVLDHSRRNAGRLMHLLGSGDAAIPAFLDDYAASILALTDLYSVTFRESYIAEASQLTTFVIAHFSDEEHIMFHFGDDTLEYPVARKMELHDHVVPSSNAMMAAALRRMAFYTESHPLLDRSQAMTVRMHHRCLKHPSSHGAWISELVREVIPAWEITIRGKGGFEAAMELRRRFGKKLLIRLTPESKSASGERLMLVPCRQKSCKAPFSSVDDLSDFLAGEEIA